MREIRHAIRKQVVRQMCVSFAGIKIAKTTWEPLANNSPRAFVLFFGFTRLVLSILAAKFPGIVFWESIMHFILKSNSRNTNRVVDPFTQVKEAEDIKCQRQNPSRKTSMTQL